ncbi:50S ribosomal protein L2 [archaeon]|nr:MAG: 50S ribosomal protein L2 [archaeon]
MGKRIIPRARGAGGPRYRSPSHRYRGRVQYFPFGSMSAQVVNILHDPGRSAPVAVVKSDGKTVLQIAPEGLQVGSVIKYGGDVAIGNVIELSNIPEGTKISGIETYPGSGPKICRSSGVFAQVLGKSGDKVSLQFSSGVIKDIDARCRATIGIPAASGRTEKPWMKTGTEWYAKHARGKVFPRSAGVAQTATDHPYGGRSKRPRPSRTVSRHAPPGQKVGSISAKRVGKRKG